MKTSENAYDVIIIGSGMGAQTTASILAQIKHKKILVLERHFKVGGFTHIFKRKGEFGSYTWDVGLHYVGNMSEDEMPRKIFDYITEGKVKWNRMPENYDTFVYPGLTFKARAGRENILNDLIAAFPHEEKSIRKYFDDLKKIAKWSTLYNTKKVLPDFTAPLRDVFLQYDTDYSQTTLKEYLSENFSDEKLKAVLASQWGDHGLPPSKVSLVIHALIFEHYIEGGYYPIGGAKTIADSIVPIIERNGGKVLTSHMVSEIIIDDWKAVGVKVIEDQKNSDPIIKEFYADTVISNAGAQITYEKLLPEKYSRRFKGYFEEIDDSSGHVNLYIGLKEDVEKLGIKGENFWIYDSYDHDEIYYFADELAEGKVKLAFVSFPGKKDPNSDGRTVEIISFAPYRLFEKWKNQPWKKRDEEYQALKKKIGDALIDFVDKRIAGFKELVDYRELSTPLSTEFFTGNMYGNIYGIPATPKRYENELISAKTPIKNLYLTGADTAAGHGITGAMMGGVTTTGIILGATGILRIFRRAGKINQQ